VFWAACLPAFVLLAVAVTEWAAPRTKRADRHPAIKPALVPGRVLLFDPARRSSLRTPDPKPAPAVTEPATVIMLHQVRRRRASRPFSGPIAVQLSQKDRRS